MANEHSMLPIPEVPITGSVCQSLNEVVFGCRQRSTTPCSNGRVRDVMEDIHVSHVKARPADSA